MSLVHSPEVREFIVTIGRWCSGPLIYPNPQAAYDQEVIAARQYGFIGGPVQVKELHKDGFEIHKVMK